MLATSATRNISVGISLLRLSDLPRAVAHTASRAPENTRINHDMRALPGRLVAHRVRHPRPGAVCYGSVTKFSHPSPGGNVRPVTSNAHRTRKVHIAWFGRLR